MLKSLITFKKGFQVCVLLVFLARTSPVYGDPGVQPPEEQPKEEQQQEQLPLWFPKVLGLQFNGVYQNVPGFHSPYVGEHSFTTAGGEGH
ncbi:MAG TPA: hypothetical protein DCP92_07430, partial [Nitrospiraceae bacterium]|nr:hypothetical protein [Nitrospiraceae bacterium]